MNEKLAGIWRQLEINKADASAMIKEHHAKEVSSGWSPKQALEHILQSEAGVLSYYKKKTQAPAVELPLADEDNHMRSRRLNNRLKSTERYSRPAIMQDPTGDKSVEDYLTYWDDLRNDWSSFLEALPEEYYKRQIYKHPLAGRLTLPQTLEFLTNHIAHHFRQLKGEQ